MSATSYSECPKCKDTRAGELDKLKKEAEANYGTVPSHQWLAMLNAMKVYEEREALEETLKELYEAGEHSEGGFFVDYYAYCSECSFHFEYHHSEDW